MKAKLIAVGERAPRWVADGFGEYRKRLSHWLPLELVEIEPGLRGKGRDPVRAASDEGGRALASVPKAGRVVMLDGAGRTWSSEQLAERLEHWRGQGQDLAFMIGGPEGHADAVRERADEAWSLGPLTLPHMLVPLAALRAALAALEGALEGRVWLPPSLAAALLANHPYHRA